MRKIVFNSLLLLCSLGLSLFLLEGLFWWFYPDPAPVDSGIASTLAGIDPPLLTKSDPPGNLLSKLTPPCLLVHFDNRRKLQPSISDFFIRF